MKLIKNIKISQEQNFVDASVLIEENIVKNVWTKEKALDFEVQEIETIDGSGNLLIPGMIDVHIHGANNYNMMDGNTKSTQEVSKACTRTGCTSFLVTSVSSSLEDIFLLIENTKKVVGKEEGAKIVGIHLEGPYLNIEKRMQNPKFLRHPNLDEMKAIFKKADGLIKMVTIAPELAGGIELIDVIKKQGDIVAGVALNFAIHSPHRIIGLLLIRPSSSDEPMKKEVRRWFRAVSHYLPLENGEVLFKQNQAYLSMEQIYPRAVSTFIRYFQDEASLQYPQKFADLSCDTPIKDKKELTKVTSPVLILTNKVDFIHPIEYGTFYHQHLTHSTYIELRSNKENSKQMQ